jgi:hypothetical protein
MHLYELLLYGISNWGYLIDAGRYIIIQWRMVCPKATGRDFSTCGDICYLGHYMGIYVP